MATRFELVAHGRSPASVRGVLQEAVDEILRLHHQLNRHDPASEIARVNRDAFRRPVQVEPRLFALLEKAAALARETAGAFDITHAAAGDSAHDSGDLRLDPETRAVRFARPGTIIDLGAIGKGNAVEHALRILTEGGVRGGLVQGGTSTVAAFGTDARGRPWRIAMPRSRAGGIPLEIELNGAALSVSVQPASLEHEMPHSLLHIVDPTDFARVLGGSLAVVACDSATESDALSTAVIVRPRQMLAAIRARANGDRAWYSNAE